MVEEQQSLCPNCRRPIAMQKGHACWPGAEHCGARDAGCFDCVFECLQETVAELRRDIERYQRKFGVLRPGLGEEKAPKRNTKRGKAHRRFGIYR